ADTPLTLFYTPSLHDALPISHLQLASLRTTHRPSFERSRTLSDAASLPSTTLSGSENFSSGLPGTCLADVGAHIAKSSCQEIGQDRKSTRLNSSHVKISYAVF